MINSIQLKNFKCFKDTGELKIAPITLLVGENNSGKSSLLEAFHLLAITLQSEDPNIVLKLFDNEIDYGSYADIVYNHDVRKLVELCFKTEAFISNIGETKYTNHDYKVIIRYGWLPNRKEIYLNNISVHDSSGLTVDITPNRYNEGKRTIKTNQVETVTDIIARKMTREWFIHDVLFDAYDAIQRKYGKEIRKNTYAFYSLYSRLIRRFASNFRRIQFLGPLRNPPNRTYLFTGEVTRKIGTKGEYALQNYSNLVKRGKKEDKIKIKRINAALYKLGFINNIKVEKYSNRFFEFWTKHKRSHLNANLADTGFGASQVFPVIISLFTSDSNSIVMFEQPELHLHPAAQAELGSIIAEACSDDKRFIIETHSENIILRLQTEVARGKLKPEDISIYYFQPDKKNHKIIDIPLNNKGEFLRKWPKGFFEESYYESLKLSKERLSNE